MDCEKIIEYLLELGCFAKFRNQSVTDWRHVMVNSDFHGLTESDHNVEYELSYFAPSRCIDCSLVFYAKNGEPCGVVVLYLLEMDGVWSFSLAGKPIEPIQFLRHVNSKDRKRISKAFIRVLFEFSKSHDLGDFVCHGYSTSNNAAISEWYLACAQHADTIKLNHQIYIDLYQDLDTIKNNFRKSYKPLIGKALRLWNPAILGPKEITNEHWREFRELHYMVSGCRNTRSEKSWMSQLSHICSGQAFLVTLRDEDHKLVGGGFFYHTRDHASYATAAYDRTLFDKPLGHLIQWIAINELKRLGVKLYTIGLLPFKNSVPKPSEKDFSIALFKSGFSNTVRIQYVFSFRACDAGKFAKM